MQKRPAMTAVVVALVGVVLVTAMIRRGSDEPASAAKEAGPLDYPRGPHGARLLTGEELQLEVTIYETGVPPQFRVYPFDANGKPIPPREVQLAIELHRLGGRVDRIGFVPESDYLRGNAVVEEPHSFDVRVKAERNGRAKDWSYSQIEGKVRLGDDAVKSTGIEIRTVGPRLMVTTLEVPGEIKPDTTRLAHVVPRLQGVVIDVLKKAGDPVRRGDLMAVISSRDLADARSTYIEASRHVEFTRVVLEREEGLWKKKISAEQDYLQAKQAFEEEQLAEDLAGQKLIALGVPAASLNQIVSEPRDSLSRYEIRAPLDGTVIERNVAVGEAVPADRDIFLIADLSSVWVEATIPAKELHTIRQGQETMVHSNDLGRDATGHVTYIGSLVGEETRSAIARIVIPNRDRQWRPGLFVSVRLVDESVTVPIAVPVEALQTFRDWQVVFIRFGDWFEARPLELGRSDGQWVEVRKGLLPGEQYAAANSFAIKAEIGKLGATHDH
ncbi:MAG: efflux RND transporter periplasmic adaptor subunit [Vicinamibacterales bacterium]|nr:efflux RND transporter periplasmic adaptor subunit [Vicinamibacterales bacterium]